MIRNIGVDTKLGAIIPGTDIGSQQVAGDDERGL